MSADYRTEHFRAWQHPTYLWIRRYYHDDWTNSEQEGEGFALTLEDAHEIQSLMDQWQQEPT